MATNLLEQISLAINGAMQTQFFQGGAVLAILTGIIYYFRDMLRWIATRLSRYLKYSVYIDETNAELFSAFTEWLKKNHPTSFRNVHASIEEIPNQLSIKNKFRIKLIQYTDFNIIWHKNRLLFINKTRQTLENSSTLFNRHLNSYTIYGFLSKNAINSILEECKQNHIAIVESYMDSQGKHIFYNSGSEWWTKTLMRIKSFDNIFFEAKEDLLNDINIFLNNKTTYEKLGISNKRGYMLSGPPGNGKSTIPLAMAKQLDMNIYYLNLSSVTSDSGLLTLVSEIRNNSILVLEDIDILVGKNNEPRAEGTKDKTSITFSNLLNTLGGVFEPDNCIIVLTTNHPEKLDSALVRAGRVDMHIKIDNPRLIDAIEFMRSFFSHSYELDISELSEADKQYRLSIPMSEVQHYCITYNICNPAHILKLIISEEDIYNKINILYVED